jgi:hypothetical protein
MPRVVSNASPIIHLAKMGYLHLLQEFHQQWLNAKIGLVPPVFRGNRKPYAKSANTDTESRCSQRKLGLPKCPFFAVGRYCGFCRSKN